MPGFCHSYHRIRNEKISRHASVSYTPPKIATLYSYPTGLDGSNVTIGIIELGGGFGPQDLQQYFGALGLPVPNVVSVPVAGGSNSHDGPGGADGEVLLDIEMAGGIAPGATIRVYFAPNSDSGFLAAVQAAISECDVVSISWGGPEDQWSQQSIQSMDSAFAAGLAKGVNTFVAAGDNGSNDGEGKPTCDFPASSPNVTACGGTSLTMNAAGQLVETVWNDGMQGGATGGGVSTFFSKPLYQSSVVFSGNGRGEPDLAANADPNTGYMVLVDGQAMVIGGTSAVAPLYAGLVARLQQAIGSRIGALNPLLYRNAGAVCRDIITGNNNAYKAQVGYDLCTGNGVVVGSSLLAVLVNSTPTPVPTPVPIPTPVPTPVPTPIPTPVPIPPPTPVPPPTPTPTPPVGIPPGLKQQIDAIFNEVIASFQGHPSIVTILRYVKEEVDVLLNQAGAQVVQLLNNYATVGIQQMTLSARSSTAQTILCQLLTLAATANPNLAIEIAVAKHLLGCA